MPRSPSRDLSDRYTGHRDYFRQPDAIRWWKYALSAVALAFGVAWGVWDRVEPARFARTHSHGPLASPHAAWDNQCEACHVPSSTSGVGVGSILTGTEGRWRTFTCEKCHAGPAHHETSTPASLRNDCAACHHDHNGRGQSLTNLSDTHCTQCHANLAGHHVGGKSVYADVNDFATHPEFRPLTRFQPSERKLKFSHSLHMMPGLVRAKDARGAMTLAQLPEAERERYRKGQQVDNAAITLECASCHQLDSGTGTPRFAQTMATLADQPRHSILPPRAEGAYFLPVNFDAHCQACHQADLNAGAATIGGNVLEPVVVPHRRQPAEIQSWLEAVYGGKVLANDAKLLNLPVGPGGRLDPLPTRPEASTLKTERDRLVKDALAKLLSPAGQSGCVKCHDATGSGESTRIQAIPDRTVWFGHAKFSHVPHRGIACADCHPGTTPNVQADGNVEVLAKEPVRIRGVESCRECHAPARLDADGPHGGIRHACTDCHRYHNGEHPLQGRGAPARAPLDPMSFRDFLRGSR